MEISSDHIVNLLKDSKLSAYRIAKDTGIADETISNYRKGKTKPSGVHLQILAKYLAGSGFKEYPKNDACVSANEPEVTLAECLRCVEKEKLIEEWRMKYYELLDETRDTERKYRDLMEEIIQSKKETSPSSSQKAG